MESPIALRRSVRIAAKIHVVPDAPKKTKLAETKRRKGFVIRKLFGELPLIRFDKNDFIKFCECLPEITKI